MKKVYIAVFGSGMGHASRMLAVARRLVGSGCEVMFSSSAEITRWLRAQGFACNDVPLVDVIFTDSGAFSAKETAKYAPLIFARMYRQVGIEARNLVRYSPDMVISDSMLSTVVAARMLGMRSVAILNQLRLESSPRTPRIAKQLLSTGSVTLGNVFWELSDKILLPDLPPPFTISEQNLWNAGSASRRAEYIGFLTQPSQRQEDGLTQTLAMDGKRKKKLIYWQISGPPKTRSTFLATAREMARTCSDDYLFVISAGDPLGSRQPKRIEGGFEYGWCPVKDSLVALADIIVTRAGHVTISELILRRKPAIFVPIRSQSEQIGNATKADKLGIGIMMDEQTLTQRTFADSVNRVQDEGFRRRLEEVEKVARQYEAITAIARTVGCEGP